jgi:uncharacterized Zn finger protein (UPF0148 family)
MSAKHECPGCGFVLPENQVYDGLLTCPSCRHQWSPEPKDGADAQTTECADEPDDCCPADDDASEWGEEQTVSDQEEADRNTPARILRRHAQRYGAKETLKQLSQMSPAKIEKVRRAIGNESSGDEAILCFLDTSFLQNLKSGIVLTDHALYVLGDGIRHSYDEIHQVVLSGRPINDMRRLSLEIGGETVVSSGDTGGARRLSAMGAALAEICGVQLNATADGGRVFTACQQGIGMTLKEGTVLLGTCRVELREDSLCLRGKFSTLLAKLHIFKLPQTIPGIIAASLVNLPAIAHAASRGQGFPIPIMRIALVGLLVTFLGGAWIAELTTRALLRRMARIREIHIPYASIYGSQLRATSTKNLFVELSVTTDVADIRPGKSLFLSIGNGYLAQTQGWDVEGTTAADFAALLKEAQLVHNEARAPAAAGV